MNNLAQWLYDKVQKITARQKLLVFFIFPLLFSWWMIDFSDLPDGQRLAFTDYSVNSPLVMAGHKVYLEQGCHYCHTMNLRPFPEEYARFSPEEEDQRLPSLVKKTDIHQETPSHLGSRRLGPDLSRINGRLSATELRILLTLRNSKLKSISHPYGFLFQRIVNPVEISWKIRAILQTTPKVYFSDAYQRSVFSVLENATEGEALIAYLLSRGAHFYQNERNFFAK